MLTIIAVVKAKPEFRDEVMKKSIKLLEPTRKEKGCINYDMNEDLKDHNTFVFHENWESRELWQDHMNSTHLAEYSEITKDMVEEWIIYELNKINK